MSAPSDEPSTDMADAPTFTHVSTVAIPVTDQDRTKALFEGLGFETRFDADLGGGFRWIELVPPGADTSIAVVATGDELPTGHRHRHPAGDTRRPRRPRAARRASGWTSASCSTGTPRR